jgi:outer membrane lipoprotein-sorting protein
LRIDFRTLQQDQEPEQVYHQQFLFDGVWLWHIDYQIKNAQGRQLTEPNEPADAFALASRRMPVLGFSEIEELEQQFAIELIEDSAGEPAPYHHLHMEVRPESVYKDDYVSVDFWIDKPRMLPARVTAVTTEQDICEIRLLEPQVNQDIDKGVFAVKIPEDFSVETVPLERKR